MSSSDTDSKTGRDVDRASEAQLDAQKWGAAQGGWIRTLGLELRQASKQEVVAEWSIDERHLQPAGIVHGGVYASVVETCCSIGAGLSAPEGQRVVGVENHTSFLRAVKEGRLRASAKPLHAGRRAQLWECTIADATGRLIATGRLRLMSVESEDRSRR